MQLTTAGSDAPAVAGHSARRTLLARCDQPALAGVIAFAAWLLFVVARLAGWADGQLSKFIAAGTVYSHATQMVPAVRHVPGKGYDGQFFYRFAINPVNWHPTAYGITIDHPYRYTRIGYSVAAWLLSGGGDAPALPFTLVLVNLLSVAGLAWVGGLLARSAGRHALWGLLFAGYFGLVISVGRDTCEPLADLCLLGGLLAYRNRRFIAAALLITYAGFVNEPVLVVPVALAVTRLWQVYRHSARSGLPDLAWALPGSVYLLLQAIQHQTVPGPPGGLADASANLTWPFTALVAGLDRDVHRLSWTHLGTYDYNALEFAVIALSLAAGFAVLRATTAPPYERLAFAGFVLLELVSASSEFWYSIFGDGRTFVDAYVMAVVLLLAAPGRVIRNRHLAGLAAAMVVVLVLVARRRILFE